MSDDPPLIPPSGKIRIRGHPPGTIIGEDDRWTLPPFDEIERMPRKELRYRIRAIIEHAERGDAQNRQGKTELAIIRAQYLSQELARQYQTRQTRVIIAMTLAITVMTLVIMVGTVSWPQVQSAVDSVLIDAAQVMARLWAALRGRF